MVRKDEPLKVTDLETGDDATSSTTSTKETATKPNSVLNRLAYGDSKKSSKKDEVTNKPETGKTGKSVTGKTSGKIPVIKSGGQQSKSAASSNNEQVQTAPPGGTSVFDRLTSGDRLYRTTQTGRKPAGRRAEATVESSSSATSSSKVNKNKLFVPAGNNSSETGGAGPAISDETGNHVIMLGSPEREETDEFNEEDPVIEISLIQPPTAKVRSPRPVLKKSARLLLSQREQLTRRKSWRLERIPVALVERTSLVRGALPVLPQGLAWICLILNGLLPGTGTILSGLLGLCLGAPRFSARVTTEHRLLAFIINLTIGIFQAFTVLFCLVGWCWALGWGIILVKTSGHYNRWKINNLDSSNEDGLPHVLVTNNPDPRY
ncbi:uncharacterized protein LOC124312402 [Daphnia pulicaria]|uniref:uncharacterized protein LOC124312402 n=1 Tax=Daphnia pulicaria TaxID=35523 RepID=UPI001EEC5C3A|nr:uncharacterized protein LOC124312402 [Daphnia pulicaria]